MSEQPERTIAQFFFEVGYGACFADAYIRGGNPPFRLTDDIVQRAWTIAGEAHDDPAEWDTYKAKADAAPDLLSSLIELLEPLERASAEMVAQGKALNEAGEAVFDRARAAISRATGEQP